MKTHILITILCGLATGLSVAQQSDGEATIRLLAERVPAELGEVILVSGKASSPAFRLSARCLGQPMLAPGRTMELRMGDAGTKLTDIVLPEDRGEHFVVLLVPAAVGYSSVVIPARTEKFREGDTFIYNHTSKPVLGHVGSSKFMLKPGRGQVVRPRGAHDDTYYDVAFGVREESGDRMLRSTRWPVVTRSRSYVFFFWNPETSKIDFRAVDECMSSAEEDNS